MRPDEPTIPPNLLSSHLPPLTTGPGGNQLGVPRRHTDAPLPLSPTFTPDSVQEPGVPHHQHCICATSRTPPEFTRSNSLITLLFAILLTSTIPPISDDAHEPGRILVFFSLLETLGLGLDLDLG